MGSDAFYPEERPVRRIEVEGFWIDRHPVTVAQFGRFVGETGYVTVAERPLDPADYPEADPADLVPGSLVFRKTRGPVDLGDVRSWWRYVPGAFWRAPEGPEQHRRGAPAPSRHPHRLRGCRHLRGLGGQGAAHRTRVGARGPRRPGGRHLRVGRRDRARRAAHGQHVAGGVPLAEPARRRLRGHVAGGDLPAQRLRAVRHDGQRVGVDRRPLGHATTASPASTPAVRRGCCPASTSRGASSRAARTCALRTTACASAPPRARARRSTPRRRTSAFAASCGRPVPPEAGRMPAPRSPSCPPTRCGRHAPLCGAGRGWEGWQP